VQTNLTSAHDAYVHTNCLAALANMAPLLRGLHPHAARSLVSLCDLFARKYLKTARAAEAKADATAAEGADAAGPDAAEGGESSEALQVSIDFLRIALEAVNLVLCAGPALNEHLVYALLERQAVFAPLRDHELFRDLIENIDLVLEHFGATLRSQPSGEPGDAVWSVQTVLTHIRDAGREWRADRMRQMADLKFTYEQEPSPEEFFTPYIWSVVYERAAIDWAPERIVLFPLEPADGPPLDEDEGGHLGPALSTIDVDDGAVTPAQ